MEIETKVAELEAENEQLRQLNQWLLDQLKLARKRQFGPTSEKNKLDEGGQLGLFNEAEVLADEQVETKEVKAHTRRVAGKIGLDKLPDDLPVEIIEHDLPTDQKSCPDCGHEMHVMASPLYRQEADWKRKGIPLSRQTMSNWLIRATKDWLQPVYSAMQAELRRRQVLHADETGLQVLREDGRPADSKSYMWMYRTSCDAKRHIVLYDYQPSRSGDCARDFLGNFKGYLHTDALRGYHTKWPPEITVVGCWAHARRRFDEALNILPKSARNTSPAASAIRQLGFGRCVHED